MAINQANTADSNQPVKLKFIGGKRALKALNNRFTNTDSFIDFKRLDIEVDLV